MSKIITDTNKINNLLTRGVEEVIDRKNLEKRLTSGEQLRIKLGIDPTSPNLHLGRSIPILKLRDFQDLGHKIVFIVGNFTGIIGDTSDKDAERPMLDQKTVETNMASYVEQAGKIIDINKCEVRYNADWLGGLTFKEIGEQANAFSVNEFISRELIKKRLDEGKRVSLREMLYPLMQGYDSVEVKADVEIGGTDQRFNLLAGRELQRLYKQEPQDIVINPLIAGLDGRKMSSSWGNTVNLTDSAQDMFGKVMSLHDDLIILYFRLLTRVDLDQVLQYEKDLQAGENPKNVKVALGKALVTMYHSEQAAREAAQEFEQIFSQGQKPTDMPQVMISESELGIIDLLVQTELVDSKSEARRMIDQGAVKINDAKIDDQNAVINVHSGDVIQVGKRKFAQIS